MNSRVLEFSTNLELVEEILTELDLQDDTSSLSLQLAEIKIELDGVRVHHNEVDRETTVHLQQIHLSNMSTRLESLVLDALGYYALAEQPRGSNEPPIGPVYAQQLLSRVRDKTINLMQLKDELHSHLDKSDERTSPGKLRRPDFNK
ncbi:MAG: hypothetical protein ABGY96_29585 [bacterium]|nr:hypothetical protein [Gammaproteobacteria bacterium]HIL94898.1 hypothetical protein [Pseudomonadales bacterium]